MPAIPLPPEICPASYCYESTAILDNDDHERHVKNVAFDPKAPHGYPTARPQPSSSSQPSITLTRMVPYGSGQQMYQGWGAFQPPPTSAAAQQQWQHAQVPPPMQAPGGPKKRAFICSINYLGTSAQLNGCINDAKCMEYLLKSKFGYTQEQLLVQVDDHPDPMRRPTKANIFLGLQWLTSGMTPGDSLVFHYSGHGGQSRDYSGEEVDGFNETLLPMDHHHAGQIVDDDLNRVLVKPLPQGVKLHAIIDACHSGSAMDLPFQATVINGAARWQSAYAGQTRAYKGTAGGFCVQFSAALDHQKAADTSKLSGGVSTGAATFCFIKAIEERGTHLAYGDLLLAMSHTLRHAGLSGGGHPQQPALGGMPIPRLPIGGKTGRLVNMVVSGLMASAGGGGVSGGGGRGQEPMLSSNYAFDLGYKFSL